MSIVKKAAAIFNMNALRAIWRWSGPVRGSILAISLLGVLSSLISLALTLVTRNLIDGATSGQAALLWRWGITLVALIAGNRGIAVVVAFLRTHSSARLQMHMQRMVTESLMGKDYAALKAYHSGQLVNRVFSDVSVVKNGVMNLLPSILQILVSFVGAAVILIGMDWRFLPVILAASMAGAVITVLFKDPMKRRHKRMQEAEDALHASTQETIENIRIVKASVSEERALNQMDDRREHLVSEQLRNGRLSIWMRNGMGSVFDISWLVCNLWGCVKIYQKTFTYGSLAALIQLVGRIQSPIANAVALATEVYGVVSSAERLLEVVELPEEEQGEPMTDFDTLCLDHVSFQYSDGNEDVLFDVNATIRRGDFVALTGISGGGKTSLFQLLLGIYRPTGGQVTFTLNGAESRASRGTRSLFAYVPQGNMLFSGTLRDNLTMFTDHATDEEVAQAAEAACLEPLIREVGLEAKLGERGVGLSEGQAQRVAVARALLSKAPILLLDEATSALDEATEAQMLANIAALRDKTVIIVTHRPAALTLCDYQLHIENGRMTRVDRVPVRE